MKQKVTILANRKQTIRQDIQKRLEIAPASAMELSKLVQIKIRDVADHLEHLAKSVKHEKKKLEILPSVCSSCGYIFEGRTRFTKPSSCPECKKTRIEPPSYQIV